MSNLQPLLNTSVIRPVFQEAGKDANFSNLLNSPVNTQHTLLIEYLSILADMQSEPVEEDICRSCKALSTSVSVIELTSNLFSCRVLYPG